MTRKERRRRRLRRGNFTPKVPTILVRKCIPSEDTMWVPLFSLSFILSFTSLSLSIHAFFLCQKFQILQLFYSNNCHRKKTGGLLCHILLLLLNFLPNRSIKRRTLSTLSCQTISPVSQTCLFFYATDLSGVVFPTKRFSLTSFSLSSLFCLMKRRFWSCFKDSIAPNNTVINSTSEKVLTIEKEECKVHHREVSK